MRSTRWGTRRFTARRCLPAANPSRKAHRSSAWTRCSSIPISRFTAEPITRPEGRSATITRRHSAGATVPPNFRSSPFFPTSFANAYVNRFNPFIMPDQLQKSSQKVDFWRANGGLRGDLGFGDWRYDGNVQVSRTQARTKSSLTRPETTMSNVLMTAVAPTGTPAQLLPLRSRGRRKPAQDLPAPAMSPAEPIMAAPAFPWISSTRDAGRGRCSAGAL